MDGSLAVLFLVASLADLGFNHCGNDGCLAQKDTSPDITLAYGNLIFRDRPVGREAYLRYDFGRTYGPFQSAVGLSITNTGDAWVGIGGTYTANFFDDHAYVQMSLLPGVYSRGNGPDLGHVIEFRSGIEVGYRAENGMRIGISYDHRSNAGISNVNPGMETLQLRVSIPLK